MVPAESFAMGSPAERDAMSQSLPGVMPDIQDLVTEDDTPVDNMPSEKQQRLLTEPLYSSWAGPGAGRPFLAAANVGVFPQPGNPAIVPDVFVSLDVQVSENWWDREHRSYFVWEFGKPPDLVVEIVSNRRGREDGGKKATYAEMGVGHYVIYDPLAQVMPEVVTVYGLRDGGYKRQELLRFPSLGLGLMLWTGVFEDVPGAWLRWTDAHGVVIPTGRERAEQERERAEQERERAEQERERAEQERERAEQEHERAEQEHERAEHVAHLLVQERQRTEHLEALLRQAGLDSQQT